MRIEVDADMSRGRDTFRVLAPLLGIMEKGVGSLPVSVQRKLLRFRMTSDSYFARAVRYSSLRTVAAACGELVDIRSMTCILAPEFLKIGSRVSIHPFVYIDATGGVTIGDDVSIAHATSILSTNHSWNLAELPIRDQPLELARTTLGDGVWVGAGVRILAGVTVGAGAIVAAGAVVTRDVEPKTIVGGVPARQIGIRPPGGEKPQQGD